MKFDGGKAVVQRILQAYGFTMQKQLHDHLGVGNGTVSTWIKRNYFPGEVVIRCALETGADLEWLATGRNNTKSSSAISVTAEIDNGLLLIPCYELKNGRLNIAEKFSLDVRIVTSPILKPEIIISRGESWLVDTSISTVFDAIWLIKRNGLYSISKIKIAPENKLKIDGDFWDASEVELLGVVKLTLIES